MNNDNVIQIFFDSFLFWGHLDCAYQAEQVVQTSSSHNIRPMFQQVITSFITRGRRHVLSEKQDNSFMIYFFVHLVIKVAL